jgi:autotransporter-associated beta strand protein
VDNKWSNPNNWDVAPQAGDDLVFQGSGISTQNDLTDRTTFNSITFSSSGFTLTGNTIWVNDGITVDSGVANATISLGVALGGQVAVDVADTSSILTVSSVVSGGGSLAKSGAGTLNLGGANTFSGGVTIYEGAIVLGNNNALGASSNVIYLDGSSASMNMNGYSSNVGDVILTDGSILGNNSSSTLTGSSYMVMNGTISANLAGTGGLTKITNDLVTLSGSDTYSGPTTVCAGELKMIGSNAWDAVFNEGGADIQGGKLVFDYTNGATPASTVLSILRTSYGNGSNPFSVGNGAKIYSSTADGAGMALGWADNGSGNVTVMYSFYGDANLDGQVEFSDLSAVIGNYHSTSNWAGGDFNYDGQVNFSDMGIVMANYGSQLAPLSLNIIGPDSISEGSTYTLTLGQVTGATAQSYAINWGDGTSPVIYTEAQVDALNRQLTHTFAGGVGNPTITVSVTDANGITYQGVAGKYVAVALLSTPIGAGPWINDFCCINDAGDTWTLTGVVIDNVDPVAGDIVNFGGVLAGYNLSTTVQSNGGFSLTVELHGLQQGTGTAQTADPDGIQSNIASYWIIA